MEKEEIEKIRPVLEKIKRHIEYQETIEIVECYIQYLEQKESILDKVTEYCKRFEYETEPIGDDDYLTERALVCEEILNIIEGGKNDKR